MKKLISILLTLLLTITLVACSSNSSIKSTEKGTDKNSETSQLKVSVIIKEGDNEVSNKEIQVKKGDKLLDILKDNFKIEETDGYITSIEDKLQDEKEGLYWTYTVNNEYATVGAGDYELKSNDEIIFTLAKFENE